MMHALALIAFLALLGSPAAAQTGSSLRYEIHVRTEANDETAIWTVHQDPDVAYLIQPGFPAERGHAWAITGPAVDRLPQLVEHERRLRAPLWRPVAEDDVVGLVQEPVYGRRETYTALEWSLERGANDREIDGAPVHHYRLSGWLQTTVTDSGGGDDPLFEGEFVTAVGADVYVRPDLPFSNAPLIVWGSAASLNARIPDMFLGQRVTEALEDVGLPVRIEADVIIDDVAVARRTWIEDLREAPAPDGAPDALEYELLPRP